jgi:hypothetical protein
VTSDELGLGDAIDSYQVLTAAHNGWVLMSHNRKDFRLLHNAWLLWRDAWGVSASVAHGGILILPHDRASDTVQRLDLFATSRPGSLADQIYEYRTSRGWVRVI